MGVKDDVKEYVGHINSAFSSHPSLDFFTTQVMNDLNEGTLENFYVSACAYLVCHKLQTLNLYNKSSSGLVTREKLGDQEVQYANPSGNNPSGGYITGYYQEYLNIMKNVFGGFIV